MDYIIERKQTEKGLPQEFILKKTITVNDINGKEVTILDNEETTTLLWLENEKKRYEHVLSEINAKIDAIKNLK